MHRPLIAIFLLFLSSLANGQTYSNVEVTSVYDGDTFKVNLSCEDRLLCKYLPVRVKGIDAPEFRTKNSCEKKKAKEAKLFTRNFLAQGPVTLKKCERDKYFRLLCEVYINDTNSLAEALLDAKLVVPYNGGKKVSKDWCK